MRRRVLLLLSAGLLWGGRKREQGNVSDGVTLLVYDPVFLEHRADNHPERPERLTAIMQTLGRVKGLRQVLPRVATLDELRLVHTDDHIGRMRRLSEKGGGWVDSDTYLTPRTFDIARTAVGALLTAVEHIAAGRARNAFCAVRPPGHHATSDRAMGFCIFNQVAVAARYVQKKTPWKKVMIVDFDVHHGNGTQDIFYGDSSVFYLSVHRAPFYPGTGAASERGSGTTLNLAFRKGTPRDEILAAYEDAVLRTARTFQPDFLLVSAGFDAYREDPIGGLGYEIDDYRRLMEVVVKIAPAGRVISTLEGGYNLEALGACVAAHLEPLLR